MIETLCITLSRGVKQPQNEKAFGQPRKIQKPPLAKLVKLNQLIIFDYI